MATQIGGIRVQVNSQKPAATSIGYGAKSLKSATDLVMVGAQDGDVIVYNSANNNFEVLPASAAIPDLDAGYF